MLHQCVIEVEKKKLPEMAQRKRTSTPIKTPRTKTGLNKKKLWPKNHIFHFCQCYRALLVQVILVWAALTSVLSLHLLHALLLCIATNLQLEFYKTVEKFYFVNSIANMPPRRVNVQVFFLFFHN